MTTPLSSAGIPRTARLAAAGLLCALAVAMAAAQPPPIAALACGGYEAVPSGKSSSGQPTRLSIQKDGRLLVTLSDRAITRVDCTDVDGDRTHELLVSSHTGGEHCCDTVHAWELAGKPRKLLEYAAGNAGGFEARDVDGDGRVELLLGDDSFAFFGDLSYARSPSRLPMIACRTPRGFEDCTRRFPGVLREALPAFTGSLKPPATPEETKQVEGAALGALALWSLLGEEEAGLEAIRHAVRNDEVSTWIERARPHVRDWLAARGKRIKDGH